MKASDGYFRLSLPGVKPPPQNLTVAVVVVVAAVVNVGACTHVKALSMTRAVDR